MRVFVINLARRAERMATMARRLDALGVKFERIEAVDGARLSDGERRKAANRFRWWCAKGSLPRAGEIGCALSHRETWRKFLELDEPCACVLEDDVSPTDGFPAALDAAERFVMEGKEARAIVLTPFVPAPVVEPEPGSFVRIPWATSTGGYILDRRAAAAMLKTTSPFPAPVDEWVRWTKTAGIRLYAARPAVCGQAEYGSQPWGSAYESDTRERGTVFVKDMSVSRRVAHKALRAVGKTLDFVITGGCAK
jgi:glycosyl transferase family 25